MLKYLPHMIDPTNYFVSLIPFGQITASGHKDDYDNAYGDGNKAFPG